MPGFRTDPLSRSGLTQPESHPGHRAGRTLGPERQLQEVARVAPPIGEILRQPRHVEALFRHLLRDGFPVLVARRDEPDVGRDLGDAYVLALGAKDYVRLAHLLRAGKHLLAL